MEETTEKRKLKRNRCHVPLTYQSAVFGESFDGTGIDYSDDGLSFESQNEIRPGTIILIKHLNCDNCTDEHEIAKGCRTATFATVKWSQERNNNGASVFQSGAQYITK